MWVEAERCVASGTSLIFLGREQSDAAQEPVHPKKRQLPPGCQAQEAVLAVASPIFSRQPKAPVAIAPPLLYFEVFIKTTGGGSSPSGTVGVGLVDDLRTGSQSPRDPDGQRRFLHYHSAKGSKFDGLPPRRAARGRPCGPSFGVGDTVGCGWTVEGVVFFTYNGCDCCLALGRACID